MKILHIITRLILGGAQQNTVMSCASQVKAGHEVHLAYGPIYGPEGSLFDQAQASGSVLHEVKSMCRAISPLRDVACYRALRKLIQQVQPDVVHTHSSKGGILGRAAAWPLEAWRRKNTTCSPRVIHTIHGLPFHDRQSRWKNCLYLTLERWAAKHCDHLVAITPAMAEAFIEAKITTRDRISVIPSGIDLSFFSPQPGQRAAVRQKFNIPQNAWVVGLVGRLDPLKGHRDLLDLLPELRKGDRDLWLLFAGDGFYREPLENHSSVKLGGVVFTGLLTLEEIPRMLSAMDVMVLPSYQEGQSRTLIEALLCGVPIAAYDVGGIGSVCIEGKTGRLVERGQRGSLAHAILDLLDKPDTARRLVAQGQQHVRENFDADTMTKQIDQLYHDLLNRK